MSTLSIPSAYREPHYSCRLFRAQYSYITRHYNAELFKRACEELGMPIDYVLQDQNWVSDQFLKDLMEKLKTLTGDPDLAIKFGRNTISPDAISPVEYVVNEALGFPLLFYLTVPSQYRRYNNVNNFRIKQWSLGKFVYEATPRGAIVSQRDVCSNTEGILSATSVFFKTQTTVEHTTCIHRGNDVCTFEVKYRAGDFWARKFKGIAPFLAGMALLRAFGQLLFAQASHHAFNITLMLAYVIAGACFFFCKRYVQLLKYIQQYNEQSLSKSNELYENYRILERKYKESNLLSELSITLSQSENPKEVITSCLKMLDDKFGYPQSIMLLLSADNRRLYTAEVRGLKKAAESVYQINLAYPAEKDAPQLFANILEEGRTKAIFDIPKFKVALKPENQELVEKLNLNSLIAAPIQDASKKYGLLVISSTGTEKPLTQEDQQLINSIAHMLSLSFQKAHNFEKETALRTLFQKYVPAMVLSGLSTQKLDSANFSAKTMLVSSLFVDLRDFTSRAEKMMPEKVVEMLSIYSEFITSRIAQYGGVVDKLVGDGVCSFFPLEIGKTEERAANSIMAALQVLADLPELSEQFTIRGYGAAELGLGLHIGRATVGNMGCDRKLDYTAVGDTVNVAARLQELSKTFRDQSPSARQGLLVLSEEALRQSGLDLPVQRLGDTTIRGRKNSEATLLVDLDGARRWLAERNGDKRVA